MEPYDILANENIQEPYAFYRRLRGEQPVYWNRQYSFWMLSGYNDVKEALRSPHLFSSRHRLPLERRRDKLPQSVHAAFDAGMEFIYGNLNSSDPPLHAPQRQTIMKALVPLIEGMVKVSLAKRVNHLVDELERKGGCDFVNDFALPLPAEVIFDLLGLTPDCREVLSGVSKLFLAFPRAAYTEDCEALENIAATAHRARETLRELIRVRRRSPGEDLISAIVSADAQGAIMSDDEIVQLCAFLLVAGHETTSNLLSGSIRHLLEDRPQWDRLIAEPTLLPGAVEELLRFVSPLLWVGRFTMEDVTIGSHVLPKGSGVVLGLGAANRDPSEFDLPETLDLRRATGRSLAFGYGIHACLGAALTKMETQAALQTLLERVPNLRLETNSFQYQPVYFIRSLISLPVSVGA